MPVTIEEAKKKRAELETLIFQEINKFEKETESSIIGVAVNRYHGGASRNGVLENIEIEVKL